MNTITKLLKLIELKKDLEKNLPKKSIEKFTQNCNLCSTLKSFNLKEFLLNLQIMFVILFIVINFFTLFKLVSIKKKN